MVPGNGCRWCGWWMGLLLLLLAPAAGAGVELGGSLGVENYLGLRHGDFYDFRNANWVRLELRLQPSDQSDALADFELRNTNFTQVQTVDQLWDRGSLDPVQWRVNQAYATLYGFLFDSDALTLDLRIGKQVLGWGKADGFNPSNLFDPLDLENPLDLRKHLGNVGLRATFTIAEEAAVLEAVVAPRFLPSLLPVELFLGDNPLDSPLMPRLPAQAQQLIEQLGLAVVPPQAQQMVLQRPAFSAGEVLAGARLAFTLFASDWSLSYFHGRDNVPAVAGSRARIASGSDAGCPDPGSSCLLVDEVSLNYPRLDVVGLNFRTDLWGMGLWGEAALVLPAGQRAPLQVSGLDGGSIEVISDEPFVKWVVGGEYTFSGGWYVNLQWLHGFFTEQTGHALHDYLFLVLRQSFLSERVKVELTLGGELDTTRGHRALGGVLIAEVSYQPSEAVFVVLGYALARGQDDTTLSLFEPLDQLYGKLLLYF